MNARYNQAIWGDANLMALHHLRMPIHPISIDLHHRVHHPILIEFIPLLPLPPLPILVESDALTNLGITQNLRWWPHRHTPLQALQSLPNALQLRRD